MEDSLATVGERTAVGSTREARSLRWQYSSDSRSPSVLGIRGSGSTRAKLTLSALHGVGGSRFSAHVWIARVADEIRNLGWLRSGFTLSLGPA